MLLVCICGSMVVHTVVAEKSSTQDYTQISTIDLDFQTNRTSISEESPQITVLTHGLNGDPSHWSHDNSFDFSYTSESIIEQLRSHIQGDDSGKDIVVIIANTDFYCDIGGESLEEETSKEVLDANPVLSQEAIAQVGAASLRAQYYCINNSKRELTLTKYNTQKDLYGKIVRYEESELVNGQLTEDEIQNHIVLIFNEQQFSYGNYFISNDKVYSQFEYILDSVSYQYKQLTGKLPTYNLIGHSRGGITNMQYALAHPYNVSSLYSMGTPYNGSFLGGLGDFVLDIANMNVKMDYEDGEYYEPGLYDILNSNLTDSYKNFWNNNYQSYYEHIDFRPIGSYVDAGFLLQCLAEFITIESDSETVKEAASFIASGVDAAITLAANATKAGIVTRSMATLLNAMGELYEIAFGENVVTNLSTYLRTIPEIVPHLDIGIVPYLCVSDDLFVDFDSQIAKGYIGANGRARLFHALDQVFNKKTLDDISIGHNLETFDSKIISYIVNNIDIGVSVQKYNLMYESDSCIITGLNYHNASELIIPESIRGYKVVGVDNLAMGITPVETSSNSSYENPSIVYQYELPSYLNDITTVIIPKDVKKIGSGAFRWFNNLYNVTFEDESELTNIESFAFGDCISLESIILPSSLKTIGYGAFAGCTSLNRFNSSTIGMLRIPDNVEQIDCYAFYGTAFESIMFGNNVNYIGDVAFANIPNLKYITISSNTKYFSQDNVLYNSDGWLMQYPVGWSNSSFSVPTTVANVPIRHISQFAFMGESDLTTINLNNVISIDSYAFMGCTSLATFDNAANVEYVGPVALDDTQIMSQTQDFVTLGKVLYRYNGTDSVLQSSDFPEGITRIASNAFCCNDDITTINLPLNITDIDNFAFVDCANLESIQYLNATLPDIGEYSFVSLNPSFKFYCRKSLIDGLDSTSNWYNEGDILEPISTEVYFEDIDIYRTFYYGETVTLPTEEISGKYIKGWLRVDETSNNTYGNYLTPSAWNETSSTAIFRADTIIIETYTLYFYNGEIQVGIAHIDIGDDYEITPTGYDINGEPYSFTNSAEMSNCVYDGYYGPAVVDGNTIATFTGWVMNGNFLTSGQWLESYSDNALYVYASWEASDYTVTLDKNGGSGGDSSITVQYGVVMPSATEPTKTGHTFRGYYTGTNGSGTKYYNADMTSAKVWDIAQDTTLYAYWQGNSYTVTLNKNGGSGGTSFVYATYKSEMPSATAPTKTGYIFKGYYTGTNGSGTKYYDANMTSVNAWDKTSGGTLYAYWEKAQYTISLINSAGTTRTTTVTYGESIEVDSIPARTDYKFVGYFSQENGQGTCYIRGVLKQEYGYYQIVGESTDAVWLQEEGGVLYAHWEKLQANITYNLSCAEDSATSSSTVTLTSGQSATIQAPSWDGYRFDHWEVNGTTYSGQALTYTFTLHISYTTGNVTIYNPDHAGSAIYSDGYIVAHYTKDPNCIAEGTLITLADGRQVPVETLTGNEMLLVWNLHTGRFDTAPILFIDHDTIARYKIINLYFSDGTHVKVIDEHAFWDFNLNKYVFLREDAGQYVGHWFNKQITDDNGNMIWTRVQLTNVTITEEYTTAWSPVTYGHLCIYVNGMLSMPGATTGLINIFEVDGETMQIDQAKYLEDIETYGLFTYEEFAEIYPIPEEMFNAVEGQYLKVSIGKGLIDYETLGKLISSYSQFFE